MATSTAEIEHWDEIWQGWTPHVVDANELAVNGGPLEKAFDAALGNVAGLRVLDIGCGSGELSVMLAKRGGKITALDTSSSAVRTTMALAAHNGVADSVHGVCGELSALPTGETFDVVMGKFILHHLEPFEAACGEIDARMAPGGRAVFLENNARNPVLMFSRKYLAGRYGIPKFGDDSEHPFEPREVDILGRHFDAVRTSFPCMVFFRLLNTYLLRHRQVLKPFAKINDAIDGTLYYVLPFSRRYSYQQIVTFAKCHVPRPAGFSKQP